MFAPWIQRLLQQGSAPVTVRLSPDFGVGLPVEIFTVTGPAYVSAEALGLTADLEADLLAWQRWYEAHLDSSQEPMESGSAGDWAHWTEEGQSLVQRLGDELGQGFEVDWA